MGQIFFLEKGFEVVNASNDFENALRDNSFQFLYDQAFAGESTNAEASIEFLLQIARSFIGIIQKDGEIEITRHFNPPAKTFYARFVNDVPFVIGSEFITITWLEEIYHQLGQIFNTEVANTEKSIADYLRSKDQSINLSGRVYFHLVESKREDFPFAFMATYATGNKDKISHLPLKSALQEYQDQKDLLKLLVAVGRVAKASPFISELVESGELFHPLQFSSDEAYLFLKETDIYEENGVTCRIPNFWKKATNRAIKLSIGKKEPSKVGLDSLLSCQPEIYIGDTEYSREEIVALLQETEGLAFLKGKWVEINHQKLQELLNLFDTSKVQKISLLEALRLESKLNDDNALLEINHGAWLSSLKDKLLNPNKLTIDKPNSSFKTTLRPYQHIGYNWLKFMNHNGFGALLADDMGLGKTVQVLALLDRIQQEGHKTLLVVPTSLLENWKRETHKFSPKLKLDILHGKNNHLDLMKADLFITTYGMIAKIDELMTTPFDLLILDEAQAIKNPSTQQTKNIKKIQAAHKLALTGTPIENNLADLWSIFDFLNKGLLGSSKEFTNFVKISKDYGKIRQLISPFILRRLKTDHTIVADLPDKIENREYISLTKKQIALYKELQNEILQSISDAEGIQRRGIVLSALTKFKQICNHPDQYLGNKQFDAKHSGKFAALKTICETIRDKHERVLIFTQFKEICKPLDDFLAEVFGVRGLVLHGGTSVKKRSEMVDQFNRRDIYTPYMVLSLKAGGVGLNLTSANHVIHFDRWWNPAIENQATDRAFRIGQEKNVLVYKFITSGSIEEKIDDMLMAKTKLSTEIISETSGEHWLTEMDNHKLQQLFTLEIE